MNIPTGPDGKAIVLTAPSDLLAALPYLLGFHPVLSLVAMSIGHAGSVSSVIRYDLPEGAEGVDQIAANCRAVLTRERVPSAVLIGYGSGGQVTPTMDAVREALRETDVKIVEALRCDGGRYWSYTCSDLGCCPVEGSPYDLTSHQVAAEAVAKGAVALPSRNALIASLAPVSGADREEMRQATALARARAHGLLRTQKDTYWFAEGLRHVEVCFAHVEANRELPADDVAWLGVLLTGIQIRDVAMTEIARRGYAVCRQLWTEVVRRVEPAYVPAPATNLAFIALGAGDGALARVAVERALAVDPEYRFARLISFGLDVGIPPAQLAEVDWAAQAHVIAELAAKQPLGARPILPPHPTTT
ncbi:MULTISPECIES: DUF4192 domain-containing protein [unclassified Nonomuraea]|uniref:DUF4192 domain-containing protein n=1 Tax=unclassified Nonomuraea TaxID=2593643 RepID=UPI0033C4B313